MTSGDQLLIERQLGHLTGWNGARVGGMATTGKTDAKRSGYRDR
ncbi:MAG: hypothetical protein ABIP87_03155 [Thermomonas sp.]